AINSTAFTNLIADLTFPPIRLFAKEAMGLSDWFDKYEGPSYGLGYYVDGSGALVPIDLRPPTTTPGISITDSDAVADQFEWTLDRSQSVQRIDTSYYYDTVPT